MLLILLVCSAQMRSVSSARRTIHLLLQLLVDRHPTLLVRGVLVRVAHLQAVGLRGTLAGVLYTLLAQ
jgi:hypothetical protein